jgi:hypothetical protein
VSACCHIGHIAPTTYRYRVTPFGLQVAIFFSRTYSRMHRTTGLPKI